MADLIQVIKTAGAFALNNANPVNAIFFEDTSCVRSDCDSQLIIVIPFTTTVRLTAIALRPVAGEEPTLLRLYVDKTELSFDDVESTRPAFEVKGASELWSGKPVPLPSTKFPGCTSVTIFIDAEGKDTTALSRVVLFGTTQEIADVSKLSAVRVPASWGARGARSLLFFPLAHTPRTPPPRAGLRTEAAPQLFQDGGRRRQGRLLGWSSLLCGEVRGWTAGGGRQPPPPAPNDAPREQRRHFCLLPWR